MIALRATLYVWRIPVDHVIDGKRQSQFVGCIAACYLFPIIVNGLNDAVSFACALSIIGTLSFSGWAYATYWPQRLAPGKYDIYFHSHQIMHFGIIACHAIEFIFIWHHAQLAQTTKIPIPQ